MNTFLRKWLLGVWLVAGLNGAVLASAPAQTFQVLGRSHVSDYGVSLSEQDWSLLRSKGVLVMGASAPDYSPFAMTTNGRDYEGLTADYAQLLSELLRTPVEVRRFASRAEVIDALKQGEVDFLGTANGYEQADHDLLMSTSYAEDQPTLVTQVANSQTLTEGLAGKKIAMLYHYLPPEAVQAFYPEATLQQALDGQRLRRSG